MTVGTILVILQRQENSDAVSYNHLFFCGVAVLTFASFLGAYMGLYTEKLYQRYGSHWQETQFYTHFLALPTLLFLGPAVFTDLEVIRNSESVFLGLPRGIVLLLVNATTQLVCTLGVNRLASTSSSLTVAVILLARKFVSLAISAYIHGSSFTTQGIVGSIIIVVATIHYAVASKLEKATEQKIKTH